MRSLALMRSRQNSTATLIVTVAYYVCMHVVWVRHVRRCFFSWTEIQYCQMSKRIKSFRYKDSTTGPVVIEVEPPKISIISICSTIVPVLIITITNHHQFILDAAEKNAG
jgi:hypothetical protein